MKKSISSLSSYQHQREHGAVAVAMAVVAMKQFCKEAKEAGASDLREGTEIRI